MTRAILAAVVLGATCSTSLAADRDTRVYEMRTYYAAPGKLEALHARFRDHTVKLFAKHGMTSVGYWVPLENPDNKLIFILAFPSEAAQQQSWEAFKADAEWQAAKKKSEVGGTLVAKVESVSMKATDYSPPLRPSAESDRVFELRVYTAAPGRLDDLHTRFRDHTVKLFAKHAITSIKYWVPLRDEQGAKNTLIYMLAHKSVEAAKASFDAFRQDPDWLAARKASEQKAGGPLTVADGVKSVFMKATDYSPLR